LRSEISEGLIELFRADTKIAATLSKLEGQVAAGALTPTAAAREALRRFRGRARHAKG
jgi:hypothetical protein